MTYMNVSTRQDTEEIPDVRIKKFTHLDVKMMTNDFRTSLLGKGGYGKVFHGITGNGEEVAVKMLIRSDIGIKGLQTEAKILAEISHKNLVKLIGYCADQSHPALVYQYMKGGSLHDRLSDKDMRRELSWRKRLRIAFDVAQGLKYLHKDCVPHVIHGDIKSGNILLTMDLEAKIGDFGLSKTVENDSVIGRLWSHWKTLVTGVYGTPEYKSDVRSFGVVLVDLITKPNLQRDYTFQSIQELLPTDEIEKIIDETIKGQQYDRNSVLRFANIAAKCTRMRHQERPDITEVVTNLTELYTAYP